MPWIHEILETEGTVITTPQGRMHAPKPTKIRIRWVEDEIEETEIVHSNWRMIRPWFACVQPTILDPILDFEADPEMILYKKGNIFGGGKIKICERCGKPITNPKPNQKFHKEGDPQNEKCWRERMQLSWQQASSNYRLKKKKWQNNEIKEKIRQITKGELQKSHDGTGGQLGTGSLGPHRNENEEKEEQIIRRELRRCGLI